MKKMLCVILPIMLLLTLFGCGGRTSGDYKLISMPEEITIDASELSDSLEVEPELYDATKLPLVASLPEDGVYVYDINQPGQYGLLLRYGKAIYYFDWVYLKGIAQPELYMADYDNDGVKELAVATLADMGQTNYNEDLRIVDFSDKEVAVTYYSATALREEIKNNLSVKADNENSTECTLEIATSKKVVDFSGKADFQGTYYNLKQDFTLGEKIYGDVTVGFIFADDAIPVDLGYDVVSEIVYLNGLCSSTKYDIRVES